MFKSSLSDCFGFLKVGWLATVHAVFEPQASYCGRRNSC